MPYLDYNSTAPLPPQVVAAMEPFLSKHFGNPSSKTTAENKFAHAAVEAARSDIARLLCCDESEVIFLSGATESCYQAILGTILAQPDAKHVVTSAVEHPAVLSLRPILESRLFRGSMTVSDVDSDGALDVEGMLSQIRNNTAVVSLMLANNETGVMFPLAEIAEQIRVRESYPPLIHTDATQAIGKLPVDFKALGVDLLSLSGHKFGAPKGVGVLLVKKDSPWSPMMVGGGQEDGRRGGTLAVSQIVGLGAAAKLAREGLFAGQDKKLRKTRSMFEELLLRKISNSQINGGQEARLPNTSSILIPGIVAIELVKRLAAKGIEVSAGSACGNKSLKTSHVLAAYGLTTVDCLATVRVSFGQALSKEELELISEIIAEEVTEMREGVSQELEQRVGF